jgi:hypothetical protein
MKNFHSSKIFNQTGQCAQYANLISNTYRESSKPHPIKPFKKALSLSQFPDSVHKTSILTKIYATKLYKAPRQSYYTVTNRSINSKQRSQSKPKHTNSINEVRQPNYLYDSLGEIKWKFIKLIKHFQLNEKQLLRQIATLKEKLNFANQKLIELQ